MNSKERVVAALNMEPVDHPAIGSPTSVATVDLMKASGAWWPEGHYEVDPMYRLVEATHTVMGYDMVMPVWGIQHEAHALGCDVEFEDQDTPRIKSHPWRRDDFYIEPDNVVIPPDFLTHNSIRVICDTITRLKKNHGDEVAVFGKVMGPWTLGYHLFGTESILINVMPDFDDASNVDRLREALDRMKEITLESARAQIDAGADFLTLADHATGDLCRGETYRDFLKPIHQEFVERISVPWVLHICGDTRDRICHIADAGVKCFHFDSKVPAQVARDEAGARLALAGNINNPDVLLNSGPEEAAKMAYDAVDAGVNIIGPECAVDPRSPMENLSAIKEAAYERFEEKQKAQKSES